MQIVFRDHAMSDQIGFHYQRYQAEHAVDDFIGKLEAIGNATGGNAGHRPTLVSIILDGENCWEYYPNGGVDFLRALYRRVAQHPKIKPVRVSRLSGQQYPATDQHRASVPGQLDPAQLRHLDRPSRVQSGLGPAVPDAAVPGARPPSSKKHPPEQLAAAWEELYIAEGSDWFWWFGDSHSSARTACSTASSASTCRMSTRCWAKIRRRPSWRGPSARGTAMRGIIHRADRAAEA